VADALTKIPAQVQVKNEPDDETNHRNDYKEGEHGREYQHDYAQQPDQGAKQKRYSDNDAEDGQAGRVGRIEEYVNRPGQPTSDGRFRPGCLRVCLRFPGVLMSLVRCGCLFCRAF
jgi:hypothetical protein